MMRSKRLKQVAFMLSEIMDMTLDEAEKVILSTNVGKKIEVCNQTYLYEQPAANLLDLVSELNNGTYKCAVAQIDVKTALDAQKKMFEDEKSQVLPLKFPNRKSMKRLSKHNRLDLNRKYLRGKRDNAVNSLKAKALETIIK